MFSHKERFWGGLVGVLLLAAVAAQAGTISDTIFRIEATNDVGWGYVEFSSSELVYHGGSNPYWTWSTGMHAIPENGDIFGDTIASLDSATLQIVSDPASGAPYRLNFGFVLHSGATLTHFRVETAQVSFPGIPAAYLQPPAGGGNATASLGATDESGDGVLMESTGGAGTGIYTTQYNGFVPTGTTFASLVNSVEGGPGSGGVGIQAYPNLTEYAAIAVDVTDMSSQLDFTLTPYDGGNGTLTYKILPEPTTSVALLALAGVVLAWRRR